MDDSIETIKSILNANTSYLSTLYVAKNTLYPVKNTMQILKENNKYTDYFNSVLEQMKELNKSLAYPLDNYYTSMKRISSILNIEKVTDLTSHMLNSLDSLNSLYMQLSHFTPISKIIEIDNKISYIYSMNKEILNKVKFDKDVDYFEYIAIKEHILEDEEKIKEKSNFLIEMIINKKFTIEFSSEKQYMLNCMLFAINKYLNEKLKGQYMHYYLFFGAEVLLKNELDVLGFYSNFIMIKEKAEKIYNELLAFCEI